MIFKPKQAFSKPMVNKCPHCSIQIDIVKINCGIFRCGLYVLKNGKIKQIPPHSNEEKVKKIFNKYKVYGCGKPFKYNNGKMVKTTWDT